LKLLCSIGYAVFCSAAVHFVATVWFLQISKLCSCYKSSCVLKCPVMLECYVHTFCFL